MPEHEDSWIGARQAWLADMLARKTGEEVWIAELRENDVHVVHHAALPDELIQSAGTHSRGKRLMTE